MKKKRKRVFPALLACILAFAALSGSGMEGAAEELPGASDPVIQLDSDMEAGQKVTYRCVWLGCYPQAEVVTEEMAGGSAFSNEALYGDGSLVVDDGLYETLSGLPEDSWDENNDALLPDGTKYRRMVSGDATYAYSGESTSYYVWADNVTWHYFQYTPVKWRVLSTDQATGQALLLADKVLDTQQYHVGQSGSAVKTTWQSSTVRSWLNGLNASYNGRGIDYTDRANFISSAFTGEEQAAIARSDVSNGANASFGTAGGDDTSDSVFLLSDSEACEAGFGFAADVSVPDEARTVESTVYAKAMGVASNTDGGCRFWLRSPGDTNYKAVMVQPSGLVYEKGQPVYLSTYGIRPALVADLSAGVCFDAGTVCTDGTVSETAAPEYVFDGSGIPSDPASESTADYDAVWFGSYPQAEVVTAERYAEYGQDMDDAMAAGGDLIVDTDVYGQLESAPEEEWDENNDIWINGVKYRRLNASGAIAYERGQGVGYYQWGTADSTTVDTTAWHYFQYEPIKWRVLQKGGGTMLLLSDLVLDGIVFHDNVLTSVVWENSAARKWLQDDFQSAAFSEDEKNIIAQTSISNSGNSLYGTPSGNDTEDGIFFLSEQEAQNTQFQFLDADAYDWARMSKSSLYAKARGVYSRTSGPYAGYCSWWLRTNGYSQSKMTFVSYAGYVNIYGANAANTATYGLRPALCISSADAEGICADAGKVSASGSVERTEEGAVSLRRAEITLSDTEYSYDGTEKTPDVTVELSGDILREGIDYTVSCTDHVETGTVLVTVNGTSGYGGTAYAVFRITGTDISEAKITLSQTSYTYDGTPKTPSVAVTLDNGEEAQAEGEEAEGDPLDGEQAQAEGEQTGSGQAEEEESEGNQAEGGRTLTEQEDYEVIYADNVNAGTATVTVKGIHAYSGTAKQTFTIKRASISTAALTLSENTYVYDGSPKMPDVAVTLKNGVVLQQGADYNISYEDNTEIGYASVTAAGIGNYSGSLMKTFRITKPVPETNETAAAPVAPTTAASIAKASVALSKTTYTYNGRAKKPSVTVELNGQTLVKNTDYSVAYTKNTQVGYASVSVIGIGTYTGIAKSTFLIRPPAPKIRQITAKKKALKITWKTVSAASADGYEVQYSLSKKFASSKTKVKTYRGAKVSAKTISKLKSKKYYVRIRAYKKVDGKKIYSAWSAVKSKTAKKK